MVAKVSELSGVALDWAVAIAEGHRPPLLRILRGKVALPDVEDPMNCDYLEYSKWWDLAGPIIEREKIDIRHTFTEGGYRTSHSVDAVHATINLPNGACTFKPEVAIWEYGPTPLIAAMRCYVTAKLGAEVELPQFTSR